MFIVSLGFAAFRFIAKNLPVFPEEVKEKEKFEGYFVIPIKEVFKE
jgi:hypothetical protein